MDNLRRPPVVGVAGEGSGVGKTTMVCRLLRALPGGWAALKYTRTELYTAIVDDPETLREHGKDTALMLEAGAAEVLWVQSPPEDLPEALEPVMDRLSAYKGIVVEGNSCVELLKPDIVIFVAAGPVDTGPSKDSARRALAIANLVIAGGPEPESSVPLEALPAGVRVFGRHQLDEAARHIAEKITGAAN